MPSGLPSLDLAHGGVGMDVDEAGDQIAAFGIHCILGGQTGAHGGDLFVKLDAAGYKGAVLENTGIFDPHGVCLPYFFSSGRLAAAAD